MKKYLIKISALLLLSAIFFTASNFCFHGLLGQTFDIKEAKAAVINDDNCGANETETKEAETSHQNSLLPCCAAETKPGMAAIDLQLSDLVKFIPAIVVSEYELVKTILISANYYKPTSSPPELLALRSTILRI
jgi:hypothetical protein